MTCFVYRVLRADPRCTSLVDRQIDEYQGMPVGGYFSRETTFDS